MASNMAEDTNEAEDDEHETDKDLSSSEEENETVSTSIKKVNFSLMSYFDYVWRS